MNGSRPVISYDDITLPYSSTDVDVTPSNNSAPSSKKRKSNNKAKKRQNKRQKQNQAVNSYTQAEYQETEEYSYQDDYEEGEEEYYEEESRELTHTEIWDDSALIDAWNAASEEYEALNGPDKGWKAQPVHKSPLWYNIPPEKVSNPPPHKKQKTGDSSGVSEGPEAIQDGDDSKPINFDTFVPTHDPSLGSAEEKPPLNGTIPNAYEITNIPGISTATPSAAGHLQELLSGGSFVSQDEAFSRALGAMYWGGYWTAMYHCQRYMANQGRQNGDTEHPKDLMEDVDEDGEYSEENAMDEEEAEGEEDEEDEDEGDGQFVSTQR